MGTYIGNTRYKVMVDEARASFLYDKYRYMCLTFEAIEQGTFTLTIPADVGTAKVTSVSYSVDNGNTWVTTNNVDNTEVVITTPTVDAGSTVLWKGSASALAISKDEYSTFSSTGTYNVCGNILSLLYGDDFAEVTSLTSNNSYCFAGLFRNSDKLTTVTKSILPATTLKQSCYQSMFQGCTSLINVPNLPATTLANNCYQNMFQDCTSLTAAPELPAISLSDYCYKQMFYNCTSLVNVPHILPATTLKKGCYDAMFSRCNFVVAPVLPAITLQPTCYQHLFSYNKSLRWVKALFTTTPNSTYTPNWLYGVTNTSDCTFVKNENATWTTVGNNGIPSNWVVQTCAADDYSYPESFS